MNKLRPFIGNIWILLALALGLLLSACGAGENTATPTPLPSATFTPAAPTGTPAPLPSPTVPPTPAAIEESLSIPASDGLEISATFRASGASGPQPGVLLLHMASSERGQWRPLADALVEAGYAVLAIDLRGYGKTGGTIDWEKAPGDIPLALEALAGRPEVDPQQLVIVGASVGANLGLVAAAEVKAVRGVAMLSPGLVFFGISAKDAIQPYGPRPILILVGSEDGYATDSSEKLAQTGADTGARAQVELHTYPTSRHGTDLLYGDEGQDAIDRVLAFVQQVAPAR